MAAADVEGQLLVTSPNATYIPTIPQGRVSLYMVADGTYGAFDPACWPQTYHPKFPYFAAVSKTAASPEFYSALWRLPEAADFVALTGVPARNFGLLTEDFMRPLQDLVVTLGKKVSNHISFFPTTAHTRLLHHYCVAKRTCERLQNIAATLRDIRVQLSLFRRHWLLAMAYMRFAHLELVPGELTARPVENDLMGAWTSEGDVAEELYLRGIPVWFVRNRLCVPLHTQIGREVEFTPPPTTYRVRMCDVPVYTGPVGYHSLLATQRTTHTYYDISLNPTVCLRTIDSALNTDHPSSTTPPILASPLPASTLVTLGRASSSDLASGERSFIYSLQISAQCLDARRLCIVRMSARAGINSRTFRMIGCPLASLPGSAPCPRSTVPNLPNLPRRYGLTGSRNLP